MTVKRKDFQKLAEHINEFLLKLSERSECATLRDSLNHALLQLQRYYRSLRKRLEIASSGLPLGESLLSHSLSGALGTSVSDAVDKFSWRWIDLELRQAALSGTLLSTVQRVDIPDIFRCVKRGDNEALDKLLRIGGGSIHSVDSIGRNAVTYSVHFSRLDMLQRLLEAGVAINHIADDGMTAIQVACHDSNSSALELLLKYKADISIPDSCGRTALHWCCKAKTATCLRLLLETKPDLNVQDGEGLTPLMWACYDDKLEHVNLLREADMQARKVGMNEDGTEFLSIDDDRDNEGRFWIHWCVRRTEPMTCLETLLTEDLTKTSDFRGHTVLHRAAELGSVAAIKIVIQVAEQSSIDLRDCNNCTPLMFATIGGNGDVVNYLITHGADLSAVDNNALTAWDHARSRHLHYCLLIMASFLQQKGKEAVQSTSGVDSPHSDVLARTQYQGTNTKVSNRINTTIPHPPSEPLTTPRTPRFQATQSVAANPRISENNRGTIHSQQGSYCQDYSQPNEHNRTVLHRRYSNNRQASVNGDNIQNGDSNQCYQDQEQCLEETLQNRNSNVASRNSENHEKRLTIARQQSSDSVQQQSGWHQSNIRARATGQIQQNNRNNWQRNVQQPIYRNNRAPQAMESETRYIQNAEPLPVYHDTEDTELDERYDSPDDFHDGDDDDDGEDDYERTGQPTSNLRQTETNNKVPQNAKNLVYQGQRLQNRTDLKQSNSSSVLNSGASQRDSYNQNIVDHQTTYAAPHVQNKQAVYRHDDRTSQIDELTGRRASQTNTQPVYRGFENNDDEENGYNKNEERFQAPTNSDSQRLSKSTQQQSTTRRAPVNQRHATTNGDQSDSRNASTDRYNTAPAVYLNMPQPERETGSVPPRFNPHFQNQQSAPVKNTSNYSLQPQLTYEDTESEISPRSPRGKYSRNRSSSQVRQNQSNTTSDYIPEGNSVSNRRSVGLRRVDVGHETRSRKQSSSLVRQQAYGRVTDHVSSSDMEENSDTLQQCIDQSVVSKSNAASEGQQSFSSSPAHSPLNTSPRRSSTRQPEITVTTSSPPRKFSNVNTSAIHVKPNVRHASQPPLAGQRVPSSHLVPLSTPPASMSSKKPKIHSPRSSSFQPFVPHSMTVTNDSGSSVQQAETAHNVLAGVGGEVARNSRQPPLQRAETVAAVHDDRLRPMEHRGESLSSEDEENDPQSMRRATHVRTTSTGRPAGSPLGHYRDDLRPQARATAYLHGPRTDQPVGAEVRTEWTRNRASAAEENTKLASQVSRMADMQRAKQRALMSNGLLPIQ